jgi:hypothetical protein
MQQTGKSTHTSVGAAFFLFLALAVIPFSLKAVGVEESLSPRLAAATDAWRQVAEAFGGGFQPGAPAELAAVNYAESELAKPIEEAIYSGERGCEHEIACISQTGCDRETACENETACEREMDALPKEPANNRDANLRKVDRARTICGKSSERSHPLAARGQLAMHVDAIEAALLAKPVEALRFLPLDPAIEKQWGNLLETHMRRGDFQMLSEIKRRQMEKELRVVVKMKSPAASRKAAECKVRTAMASAMRLISEPIAAPDNCEL